MKKIWPFSYYFWQLAGVAFWAPFYVLFYQSLGFSGTEIGLLTGISPLLTLVCAPLWTGLADHTRRHRLVLSVTLLGSILALTGIPFFRLFGPVMALTVVFGAFYAPVSSLADTAAVRILGDDKAMYSRLRLGGTLGYALMAPVAGWFVQRYGYSAAFWGCAVLFCVALLINQKIWPPITHPAGPAPEHAPVSVGAGSRALMSNPRWLLFLVGAFAGGVTLAATNNYLYPYLKELGAPATTMGFATLLGSGLEIPLMFFGYLLLRRFKAYHVFLAALALSAARLLLMAAAVDIPQALVVQLLLGSTFPAMWMAGVAHADENAPPGLRATAQGLFNAAVFGVGLAVGSFVGGPLLVTFGAHGVFLAFGVTVLMLLAVVMGVGRVLPSARANRVAKPENVE